MIFPRINSVTVIDKTHGRSVIPADVTSEHARSILLTGYYGPDTDGNGQALTEAKVWYLAKDGKLTETAPTD